MSIRVHCDRCSEESTAHKPEVVIVEMHFEKPAASVNQLGEDANCLRRFHLCDGCKRHFASMVLAFIQRRAFVEEKLDE